MNNTHVYPKKMRTILALFLTIVSINSVQAATERLYNATYEVCFVPGQDCAQELVDQIGHAKYSINVQAYSFTSVPIARSLVQAKQRGVEVEIILDKSQFKHNKYSSAKYFIDQGIPVWIDYRPAIAHNKVMIFDKETVMTGSFNFTKAASTKNAENLLIIHDKQLAMAYLNNWYRRQAESRQARY